MKCYALHKFSESDKSVFKADVALKYAGDEEMFKHRCGLKKMPIFIPHVGKCGRHGELKKNLSEFKNVGIWRIDTAFCELKYCLGLENLTYFS